MDADELTKLRIELQADPKNPRIHLRMGRCLFEQGGYEQAATAARRALQLGMDSVDVRLLLGKALMEQGCPCEAAFQFLQLLERYPDHAEATACYESIRRIVAAVDVVRKSNPPQLQLDVRNYVVILALRGTLAPYSEDGDLRAAFDRLSVALARLLQLGLIGCAIDLSQVSFVTSFFLSKLLEWRRRLIGREHGMVICQAMPEIRELLVSSQVSRLIPVVDTREQAIRLIEAAGPTPARRRANG